MTTETRLVDLAQLLGADVKALRGKDADLAVLIGDLGSLHTNLKSSLVDALNEIFVTRPTIDDMGIPAVNKTYSTDKLNTVFNAFGTAIGDIGALDTSDKSDLVSAINEIFNRPSGGASIDDTAPAADKVYSSQKVVAAIAALINDSVPGTATAYSGSKVVALISALRDELVNGAGAALDTFKELQDAIGNDPTFAQTIATQMSKRPRVDSAQTFTTAEKLQVCTNMGIGNPEVDLVAAYNAAKA